MTQELLISRRLHQGMQIVAAFSLIFFAGMLHLHEVDEYHHWWKFCLWGSAAVYPLYVIEMLFLLAFRQPAWKRHLLYCVLPPLRLMAPHPITGEVWLPRVGWTKLSSELTSGAERAFALPMIVIALLILPVMGIEHYLKNKPPESAIDVSGIEGASDASTLFAMSIAKTVAAPQRPSNDNYLAEHPLFKLGLVLATCVIWLAFTVEFVVMMSLNDKKLRYCVKHWLDLAIIILPLIAFLRAARLTRLARLQRLSKTARIYRMRGTAIKLQRAIMMMSLVKRFLHANPEKRLKSLSEKLREKAEEVRVIEEEMEELRERIAQSDAADEELATDPYAA